jgi:hypothetical protein
MSSSTPADTSEDVNDFLQRIKELGDKRDQEDEERNRKLEEEILQGRKERQARRAGKSSQFLSAAAGRNVLAQRTVEYLADYRTQSAPDRFLPPNPLLQIPRHLLRRLCCNRATCPET